MSLSRRQDAGRRLVKPDELLVHTQSSSQATKNAFFASHHEELLHQVHSQGLDQISGSPSSTCVPKLQLSNYCKSCPPCVYLKLCCYQSKLLVLHAQMCWERPNKTIHYSPRFLLDFHMPAVHQSSTFCWVSTTEAKCNGWRSSLPPPPTLLTPAQELCFTLSVSTV